MFEEYKIKTKEQLLDTSEILISLENFEAESFVDTLLHYYVYGNDTIDGMSKEEIFWFAMDIACKMVNRGGILSKWIIGKELVHINGYTSTNVMTSDVVLGKFLIEMAAQEGQSDACYYMASKYNDLQFGYDEIANYWLEKSSSRVGSMKKGECLNVYIYVSTEYGLEGRKFIAFKNGK